MAAILLTQDDIDSEFPSLPFDPDDSGIVGNAETAEYTFEPDDTESDITAAGRVTGYRHVFFNSQALFGRSEGGPVGIDSHIHVLKDEDSAAAFLVMLSTEANRLEDQEIGEGVTLRSVTPVISEVVLGDGLEGYQAELDVAALGKSFLRWEVFWRRGTAVLSLGFYGLPGSDPDSALYRLAVKMDEKIGPALAGEITAAPLPVVKEEPVPAPSVTTPMPTPTAHTTRSGEGGTSFVSVSAGGGHSCGVKTDGIVECWGSDSDGEARPPEGTFASVSAGRSHTCGIRTDGTVECWGRDYLGAATPPDGTFASVGAGDGHTCAVKTDGLVVCWGANWHGESTPPDSSFKSVSAGDGHTCGVKADESVECWGSGDSFKVRVPGGAFASVSAGTNHTCGVRTDGTVACWGADGEGQATPPDGTFASVSAGSRHTCGVKTDGSIACWGSNDDFFNFVGQATPPEGSFTSVSAGMDHSCGAKTDGSVVCWGNDEDGKATAPGQPLPTPFTARSGGEVGPFASVSAGTAHTCGLRTDGSVVCWGSNEDWFGSSLGQAAPPAGSFVSVSAGSGHTCGVRTDGFVECWGDDSYGQATPLGGAFASISAGALHTCGVRTDGSIACWGSNDDGQTSPPEGIFASISAGTDYTCGLGTDGSVQCWGNAGDENDFFDHDSPPEGAFASVSAGTFHTCGVKTDGTVQCWGSDSDGEATPPEGTFTAVDVGYEHSCGVKTDGSIVCWGNNRSLGDFIGQATPPEGAFSSVSAGYEHTCGVETGGAVVCWGSNEDGQASPPDVAPVAQVVDDDHGNSGLEATPVVVGDTVQGEIEHGTDVDFFAFNVEEDKFYQIDVTLGTLSDSVANLYDGDIRWLTANDDQGDSLASRIFWKAPRTERHHVSVTGAYSDDLGSYTLAIVEYEDSDDHADSASGASAVTSGEAVQGSLEYHGDADYFAFQARASELYRIDVALGTLSDSTVALYDAGEHELASNDDQGDSWASRLHWKAPASGRYYVVVEGYDVGSYTLTITSGITDDHRDSRAEATSVKVNAVAWGTLDFENDVDVFVYEAKEGKTYQVELTLGTLSGANIVLADPDGDGLAWTSGQSSFDRLSTLGLDAETSGVHYVQVAGNHTRGTGTYTLRVTVPRESLEALYNATDGANWKNSEGWLSGRPIGEWYGVVTDIHGRVIGLNLQDNGLTGEIPPDLGHLHSLQGLYLNENGLTGEIPTELSGLPHLVELALWGNQLSGDIPPALGNLTNLVALAVGLNQLTGEIPSKLGDLASLEQLGLQQNRLTGGIPPELGNLSDLVVLALSDNRLTGEISPELGRLANLESLYLGGNQLSGCVPGSLKDQLDMHLSDLGGLPFCSSAPATAHAVD